MDEQLSQHLTIIGWHTMRIESEVRKSMKRYLVKSKLGIDRDFKV